jgi:hypothetical protein
MSQDTLRWKTAVTGNLEGPFADINEHYAAVWVAMDSYGRVFHVTNDLGDAEKRLDGIRTHFRDALHALRMPVKINDIYVDGLPGGRNRMVMSFYFAPVGGVWSTTDQEIVTNALNGHGIRDYKPLPKTASADRHKNAGEYAPDPLTYKAFLSEFKQGVVAGADEASQATSGVEAVGVHGYITQADDLVTAASQELLDLAKRLVMIASRGRGVIAINEHRLVPKMSGILSTFFYNIGKLRGLQHGNPES